MASSPSYTRANILYAAKLAARIEQYGELSNVMKYVAKKEGELAEEEMHLLSEAYKNKIQPRIASWKILSSELEKESDETNTDTVNVLRERVEAKITQICKDLLLLLEDHLLPSCKCSASVAFYYMMKGDCCCYLAEIKTGSDKKEVVDKAIREYDSAMLVSRMDLPPADPVRLHVALNYSIFHYDFLGCPDGACEMAKEAFDEAVSGLDSLSEEAREVSTQIMELLLDNVTQWKAEKLMVKKLEHLEKK